MWIAELWRYPVKSIAGERIERAEVTDTGIVGDRMVLVVGPGDRIITAAEAAKLRGVSRETLRLLSERGLGPKRIQLSRRRFGYLASDFIELG